MVVRMINIPLGTKGRFKVDLPFTVDPVESYICGAIRYFKDIENDGKNVFEVYYLPYEIAYERYESDRLNNVPILTLLSDRYSPLYIPASFILEFPDVDAYEYKNVIMSASLGALPGNVSLDFTLDQVKQAIRSTLGLEPVINLGVMPVIGSLTPEEHATAEAARQAAITNTVTDYSRYLAELNKNVQLTERIRILEQLVIDNNLLP